RCRSRLAARPQRVCPRKEFAIFFWPASVTIIPHGTSSPSRAPGLLGDSAERATLSRQVANGLTSVKVKAGPSLPRLSKRRHDGKKHQLAQWLDDPPAQPLRKHGPRP